MTNAEKIGIQIPEILLPGQDVDLKKWAVIACDQFTSNLSIGSESLLSLEIRLLLPSDLPEAWLTRPDKSERIQYSQSKMSEYVESGLLEPHKGFVLVERSVGNAIQTGLIVALDLENMITTKARNL
jgi:hypothetical protein